MQQYSDCKIVIVKWYSDVFLDNTYFKSIKTEYQLKLLVTQ